jgi:hypothetical protein
MACSGGAFHVAEPNNLAFEDVAARPNRLEQRDSARSLVEALAAYISLRKLRFRSYSGDTERFNINPGRSGP